LVTVDTTRADLVPGFGGDLEPADMPFMNAWSTSTRRFTHAYAPTALTGPSHTSILSGQHVLEHQILANGRTIPEDTPWVPERLHAAGWFTRAWVSAAVLDARLGFHRGFRVYDSKFDRRLVYGHPLLAWVPRRRVGGTGFTRADPHTVDQVIHSPSPDGRTFTWVHLYGPHWPYTPDPVHADALGVAPTLDLGRDGPVPLNHKTDLSERTRNHAVALYRAELRTLDDQLKRLLTSIPEETRVVVVADHGESLDEHGLFFNHGRLATAPSTRVPLWVRGPGYPPGTDDRTVSLHQLAPTLLHLADEPHEDMGVALHETSADAVSVSVSSAAVFEAADAPHLHSLGDLASVAVRSGQMSKTASVWHAPGWSQLSTNPRELWGADDVVDDTNATDSATATVTQIETAWRHAIATPLRGSAPASEDVDAETKAALEALGYIEGQ